MKNSPILTLCLCALLLGSAPIFAQHNISEPKTVKNSPTLKIKKSNVKVQRYTVMSRFETSIAKTEEERMQMKHERIALTELRLSILDTLDISDRKKRKLLRDLKYSPFSDRLEKATLVDTEFQDETENDNK